MPFAQQPIQGYQDSMVPFGEWTPDASRNIKPGYPLFWVNGSPVQMMEALNVAWTASAYRPLPSPVAQGAACPAQPLDVWTGRYNETAWIVVGTASSLYYSTNGGSSWTQCGSGYTASAWSFAQYGSCIYATDNKDVIQVMDLSATTPTFSPLAASTAPVAARLGIIRDFVVAGNIASSPQDEAVGAWMLQWSGLAAPATWDDPNTQQARADQSGAQALYSQYGAVQFIAQGEELAMVFQETGISRVQYVGGDVVFSFYTFERKRGLVTPRAAVQTGNTVFFLSADGFYATDGSQVQPIGYGKVNLWFADDCVDVTQVRAAYDSVRQCVVWSYPSKSNPSGWGQLVYNVPEGQWTRGNYVSPLLFQLMNGPAYEPATFTSTFQIAPFNGTATSCTLSTGNFRFDPSHHSIVVSVRVLSDDDNAQAACCGSNADTDTPAFVYASPTPIGQNVPVRTNAFSQAVSVLLSQAFTYCQGVGVKYTLGGSR